LADLAVYLFVMIRGVGNVKCIQLKTLAGPKFGKRSEERMEEEISKPTEQHGHPVSGVDNKGKRHIH